MFAEKFQKYAKINAFPPSGDEFFFKIKNLGVEKDSILIPDSK